LHDGVKIAWDPALGHQLTAKLIRLLLLHMQNVSGCLFVDWAHRKSPMVSFPHDVRNVYQVIPAGASRCAEITQYGNHTQELPFLDVHLHPLVDFSGFKALSAIIGCSTIMSDFITLSSLMADDFRGSIDIPCP